MQLALYLECFLVLITVTVMYNGKQISHRTMSANAVKAGFIW